MLALSERAGRRYLGRELYIHRHNILIFQLGHVRQRDCTRLLHCFGQNGRRLHHNVRHVHGLATRCRRRRADFAVAPRRVKRLHMVHLANTSNTGRSQRRIHGHAQPFAIQLAGNRAVCAANTIPCPAKSIGHADTRPRRRNTIAHGHQGTQARLAKPHADPSTKATKTVVIRNADPVPFETS